MMNMNNTSNLLFKLIMPRKQVNLNKLNESTQCQIHESTQCQVHESILKPLKEFHHNKFHEQLPKVYRKVFPPRPKEKKEELRLYTIIRDNKAFKAQMWPLIIAEQDPIVRKKNMAAFHELFRSLVKFQLKHLTITYLYVNRRWNDGIVEGLLDELLTKLQRKKIGLAFNENNDIKKAPNVTIELTIELIVKLLIEADSSLHKIITFMDKLYYSDISGSCVSRLGTFNQRLINRMNFYELLKPIESKGDDYYIWQVLFNWYQANPCPGWSYDQRKQFAPYFTELNYLFTFFLIPDITYDFKPFFTKKNTINSPLKTFTSPERIPDKVFKRFLRAVDKFVLNSWAQLLMQRSSASAKTNITSSNAHDKNSSK